MYCSACGQPVEDDANFCPSCGKQLKQLPAVQTPPTVPVAPPAPVIEVKIHCPHCYSIFLLDSELWPETDQEYECPKCGGSIPVAFSGYCSQHHDYVAFRPYNTKEMVSLGILSGIVGYYNPRQAIGNFIGTLLDSTPKCSANGVCPVCQAEFLKCPRCGQAVHITYDDHGEVNCPQCHLHFRMR